MAPSLEQRRAEVLRQALEHVRRSERLLVLQAPPGSGKTFTVSHVVALSVMDMGGRVAVATQTNAQADDLCRRLIEEFPRLGVTRFLAAEGPPPELPETVRRARSVAALPGSAGAVVGTSAKWALSKNLGPFDLLVVDEAWQLTHADFSLLVPVAPRVVLVGDPGQIAPVVPVDASRWEAGPVRPHQAAPAVLLAAAPPSLNTLSLPVSTRLTPDTVELLRPFYDFPFEAWSRPGARRVSFDGDGDDDLDEALELLETGAVAMLELPTPVDGPPLEDDPELAATLALAARRLLARGAKVQTEDEERVLTPEDVGIVATHRVLVTRIQQALGDLPVRVDTPERWQGLERPVILAAHPLSGALRPSSFDLDTGRLCVMASRHRVGLLWVGRDHLLETLRSYVPSAEQAPSAPDAVGRGHHRHLEFLEALRRAGRCIRGSVAPED